MRRLYVDLVDLRWKSVAGEGPLATRSTRRE